MIPEKCEIRECNELINIDNHHIHSLSKGGKDKKWNKCKLCPNCHRKVHMGEIIIEGRFQTTNGNMIVYRNKNEKSITGLPDPPVWLYNNINTNKDLINTFLDLSI